MGMAIDTQFHVLAVDDSLIDRKLIERLLRISSFQVTTVDSGTKALEFLGLRENVQSNRETPSMSPENHREVEVNLIITDYCMPGMTGYDLLKKIKESSSFRNIPVVIMSSENVPSRISRCLEEGAEEFFLKPLRLADLNKLKPHMMRSKLKDQMQDKQENHEGPEVEQQKQQNHHALQQQQQQPEIEEQVSQMPEEQQQQLQPAQLLPQSNNNKRKSVEQGLSPDTSRPRYSGIATVV